MAMPPRQETRRMIIAAPLVALVVAQASPAAPTFDTKELGRQCSAQFFAGDTDNLWMRFSPTMKQAFKTQDAFVAFQAKAMRDLGPETELVDEVVTPLMSYQVYLRTVRTKRWPSPVEIMWSFDDRGQVVGFYVKPKRQLAESRFLDYQTKTALHLPFKGAWTVFWGGRTLEQNQHAMFANQRFAYDFDIEKDGVSHRGDGTQNAQFYAYGQPVIAPAAGKVVAAVDGVPDNKPGEMNDAQLAGNYLVIDHGHGEFSLLAHLKPGSEKVKVGQAVKAGQVLALCGNSGNSSEPHLHYQLQNGPTFGQAECLPAQFQDYKADTTLVKRGEPTKGQVITP
jgi:murein DD-endopeptidase MepM/ murein hydrolase activator NlpD